MKGHIGSVLGWWEARAPRERFLLLAMMVVLGVWLALVAIWQPLQASRLSLENQIVRYQGALSVLQSQPVPAAPVFATDDRPLNIIITETTAAHQLTIRRLEPDGQRVGVVLDEAAFDSVILWLEAVQRDHGLKVAEIEMTRRPAPGVVNATLALER